MAGLQASGYPGRLGNPKPTGKQNKEPKKCVRMGDFIVFSSVEEDEEAFLASSSVDGEDSVVVTQTKTRKCVFEILPIIHNTARKAFRRAQKTSSDPSELKKLEEMAVKEAQQNKDMCNQMEGTPVKYGQIIQLAHAESGNRYLTGSNSEAALLENSCARVFLRPNSGKKCWFKLLPEGEIPAEGKIIPIGGEAYIAPANIDLMYIHRSNWTDEQGEYEANLSLAMTNWVVELFDTSGKKNLKAGAMLRLLHQKAGYLGNFDRNTEAETLKDSLCFRYVPPSKRNRPTKTTNSIWVTELESSTAGSVNYTSKVRFNLWGTNKYLAFHSDRSQVQASLVPKNKEDTLFRFHKYDLKDTGKVVSLNSFATLQHIKTKHWLKGVPLLEDPKYWAIECSSKSNQSDFIHLVPVSQSQASLIEYIQKRRVDLDAYVLRLRKKERLSVLGTPIVETLIELIQWVTDPPPPQEDPLIDVGKPIKERQRLLGSPGLLGVLVELIWRPFEKGYNSFEVLETNPDFRFQCELVYGLLVKTAMGRNKVCARLFRYLDVFSSQIGTGLSIYPLLEEIFRKSKDLCKILAPSQLERFIDVMAGGADPGEGPAIFLGSTPFLSPQGISSPREITPRKFGSLMRARNKRGVVRSAEFLDFLAELCVSRGEANANNQDLICSRLLVNYSEYFLDTRAENGKVYISVDEAEEMPIDQFLWTADRALVKFHVSSLNLFYHLCFGRNSSSIREVRKFITGKEAMCGLMCKDLPFALRTAYCSVLHHVYLDCHPHKQEKIPTVYASRKRKAEKERNWEGRERESESEGEEFHPRGGVEIEPLMQREDCLSVGLFDEERAPSEVDWLEFVEFLEKLFSSVKVDSSFLNLFILELLKLLKSLLSFELYTLPPKGDFVSSLMRILCIYLDKGMTISRPETHHEEIVFAIKAEVCNIFGVTFLHNLHQRLKETASLCEQSLQPEAILASQIAAEREFIKSGKSAEKLETILFPLLRHDDEKLSGMAMRLLVSSRSNQIAAYERISKKMRFLASEEELFAHDKVVEECIPCLNLARDSLLSCDLLEVTKRIRDLVDMCILQQRKKQMLPNERNQDLLSHLGAHQAVIRLLEAMPKTVFDSLLRLKRGQGAPPDSPIDDIMRSEMDILSMAEQEKLRSVYTGCYVFLNKFCNQNPRNQALLFPHLQVYISHLQLGITADDTLISLFTDNEALCRKLPPHVIISILGIVKENPREAIKPLRFLQAIAMPGGSANRSIQSMILKQIVGKANEYCPLLSPEMCGELIRKSNSVHDCDQELVNYYGEIVNVLSACAHGKSHAAEATCQNLLPLSAILETLNRTLNLNLRNAFARFLDEVWFHTEIFVPELVFIQSNSHLWLVFSMFSDQMMDFCDFLRGKTKKTFVRRRGTFLQPASASASLPSLPQVVPDDELRSDEMSESNIGEWTRYLCDQVIPLLQHFYEKLFAREKALRDQTEITGEIFDSCCSMLQTRLAHKERVAKIGQCLEALIKTGLIDNQRAKRSKDISGTKMKEMQKHRRVRRIPTNETSLSKQAKQNSGSKTVNMDETEFDAEGIVGFRLAVKDVPAVFGPLASLFGRKQAMEYAALLSGIIKDGSIEDMELKLSCLRFLRYIAWDGELDDIKGEAAWKELKARQNILASFDLVPASLALLGPAKDDEDVCTQALDLALVLTYKNKHVRDALMEHYFTVSEEVVWIDLRTLIQNSIAHIRTQKSSRPVADYWGEGKEFQPTRSTSRADISARRFSAINRDEREKKGPLVISGGLDVLALGSPDKVLRAVQPFAPEYHRDFRPSVLGEYPQLPYTRMVFRFMQSLCIDHDEKVQRYLHYQDDNYQSVDLVRESALYLRMIDDFANPDTLDDIQQCIVFMQDLAIGSRQNQLDLVAVGVCESLDLLLCKNILPLGVTEEEKEENILIELELQLKVTELLLTLLEGNSETIIPTTMITTLSFSTLLYHAQYLQQTDGVMGDDSETVKIRKMDLAKNTFRLIKMLGETNPSRIPDEMKDTLKQAFDFVNSTSSRSAIGRIEIVAADRSLQRLYFPVPASCQPLDTTDLQKDLEDFLTSGNVDWQSPTERVEALCRWFEYLLINVEHEANSKPYFFVPYRKWIIFFAIFYALLLNVLIITFADTSKGFRRNMGPVLQIMGIVELLSAILILVAYGQKYGRPLHYHYWKDRYNKVYHRLRTNADREEDIPIYPPSVLFREDQRDAYIYDVLEYLQPRNAPLHIKFALYSSWHFLIDFRIDGILYQCAYILITLLGILVHPFFYCFLLLDIVRISPPLRTVLLTIYLIKWRLFFIGLLICSLIWIFSLYVFLFIPEAFDPANGTYCDYPLQCAITLSHIGISLAGATIEFMNISPWNETGSFMGIVIFDILFYIVIGMILFNIIFAVIVDKFGQLRDNRAAVLSDMINRCFICAIEREVFQQVISEKGHQGTGNNIFLDHITQDHRAWNYLFFFEYLKWKTDQMTSNEEHVLKHVMESRWLAFMPVGRAKIIEIADEEGEEETINNQFETLSKSLAATSRLLGRLHNKMDAALASNSSGLDLELEEGLSDRSEEVAIDELGDDEVVVEYLRSHSDDNLFDLQDPSEGGLF